MTAASSNRPADGSERSMLADGKLHDSIRVSFPRQFTHTLLALLFPTACPLCDGELVGTAAGTICSTCWRSLEAWDGPICFRCGLPLAAGPADSLCSECRLERPRFDCARSYGIYAGRLRAAVLELKFHGRDRLGARLGALLTEPWLALQAASGLTGSWMVMPVPLHGSRQRERGYNQAALLARGFARALRKGSGSFGGFHLESRSLARKRATAPQSGLSLTARRDNVRSVFHVTRPDRVRDCGIILVDDVMTTGATASACAGALKRAGARRVVVLALARATPQFPDAGRP